MRGKEAGKKRNDKEDGLLNIQTRSHDTAVI